MENPNLNHRRNLIEVIVDFILRSGRPNLNLPLSKRNVEKRLRKKGK